VRKFQAKSGPSNAKAGYQFQIGNGIEGWLVDAVADPDTTAALLVALIVKFPDT